MTEAGMRQPGGPTVAGAWPRDVLLVRGPDAVAFLHGQVSADVVTLEPGQSTLALLLEPTGKLEAVLRLWRTDEHVVVIDTDAGAGAAVEARLRRFLLRTDATIEQLDWQCAVVRGPDAPAVDVEGSGAQLVGLGMWPTIEGIDLLGPSVSPPVPPAEPATPELLEAMRIEAGWPAHGAEATTGVIPAEIGPWLITAAVSFTKGCYVGQELTARIDSRGGNVPRNLRSVELPEGRSAAVGDDLVLADDGQGGDGSGADGPGADAGEAVGSVTSAAVDPRTGRTRVLGFVKRAVPSDAALAVRPA